MDVTVIICTWNRSKSLAKVLASLEASVVPPQIQWEVLVVDNNSKDHTHDVCETFIARNPGRFRYLFAAQQGKSNALNAGIQNAAGEILAFTDDDVTVDEHWVAEIYDAFQKHDCAAVAGRIIAQWNCKQPAWIDLDGPFRHVAFGAIVRFEKGDAPCLLKETAAGANMALKRTVVDKYGLFRADLSGNHADRRRLGELLGGEDTEYCRRLLNAGERLMYAPQAKVSHPVEEHRLEKGYLQRFAFYYGRYATRMGGIPEIVKCYFGIPRYLFPVALKNFAKWATSFRVKRRFFYRLELFHNFGEMIEGKRLVKMRQSASLLARESD